MSAGSMSPFAPDHDLSKLAPKFREAVERALKRCDEKQLNAKVFEANRSAELQESYYERGRTQIPPTSTVTNAKSNLFSWHGYGLAVDVIHRELEWNAPQAWFEEVAGCFRAEGCRWGGEWKFKDLPHFQWGLCKPSPSDLARSLLASGGLQAVWEAVDADSSVAPPIGHSLSPQRDRAVTHAAGSQAARSTDS
jgi:peptidoglycan L-alanyl-D-glutamate endopeptidase CwlK